MLNLIIKKQCNINRKYFSTNILNSSSDITSKEKISNIIRKSLILSYGIYIFQLFIIIIIIIIIIKIFFLIINIYIYLYIYIYI
jgi:maltodextrin utilization protein YvdJ